MQFLAAAPSCLSCRPLRFLAATGSLSVALVLVCGPEAGGFMKFEIVLLELTTNLIILLLLLSRISRV